MTTEIFENKPAHSWLGEPSCGFRVLELPAVVGTEHLTSVGIQQVRPEARREVRTRFPSKRIVDRAMDVCPYTKTNTELNPRGSKDMTSRQPGYTSSQSARRTEYVVWVKS